ncbi:MAG: 6-bladed beta-propeller [candidate division KSB1 bacterium]|nr:6-bladed beta-propeller [candidate division KSB1 bacterium]
MNSILRRYIKLIVSLWFGLLLISCQKNSRESSNELALPISLMEKFQQAKNFEDLFEKSKEIQLATGTKSYVGSIDQIIKSDERFIVVDTRVTKSVLLFSETGKFIRQVGINGEGPGEYLIPEYACVDNEGRIVILDSQKFKLIFYDRNGEYQKQMRLDVLGIFPQRFFIDSHGLLYFYTINPSFSDASKGKKIVVIDQNGRIKYRYSELEETLQKIFYLGGSVKLAPNGQIWIGNIFDLTIRIHDPNGQVQRTIIEHISHLPNAVSPEIFASVDNSRTMLKLISQHTMIHDIFFIQDNIAMVTFVGNETYYLSFFDLKGNLLKGKIEIDTENSKYLKSAILGSYGNCIFAVEEPIDIDIPLISNALQNVLNPKIVVFKFKL